MGCGRLGSTLAHKLEAGGHTVAVIDQNADAFRRLGPEFSGTTVTGIGFDGDVLRSAGIERADAFAAVSSGDNSNIISARLARETFGVSRVVARIYDARRALVYERLGIPTVATIRWAADRMVRHLVPEGTVEVFRDPTSAISIVEAPLHRDWVGLTLKSLEEATGAGNVGRSIAQELIGNGHQVMLIERQPRQLRPERVPEAEWVLADACELSSLEEAEVAGCDVVVAATGDDKANLVCSLLAKTEFAVARVVARVNRAENEWLFTEQWGVDVAVSKPRLMAALVEEAVTVGDLVRIMTFRQGEANLVEITLPAQAPYVGEPVRSVPLPRDAVLVAILRGKRVLVPSPDDPMEAGDELMFLATEDMEDQIHDAVSGPSDPSE